VPSDSDQFGGLWVIMREGQAMMHDLVLLESLLPVTGSNKGGELVHLLVDVHRVSDRLNLMGNRRYRYSTALVSHILTINVNLITKSHPTYSQINIDHHIFEWKRFPLTYFLPKVFSIIRSVMGWISFQSLFALRDKGCPLCIFPAIFSRSRASL
jgi:hypothetical protein